MKTIIKVGLSTCGISAGGIAVYQQFQKMIRDSRKDFILKETGCIGMCYQEVLTEIIIGERSFMYGTMTPDKVYRVFTEHLIEQKPVTEWLLNDEVEHFLKDQRRIALRNCGKIDPGSLEEYMAEKGYNALKKCLTSMTPDQIIDIVTKSGLRGRGGAGFSTGLKWKFAKDNQADQKYIVCNADEGDPGAFMDRSVLEADPHSVIEGMIIGALAIGATEGYIYVRSEYPLAIKRLQKAIEQCSENNLLGRNILHSPFTFHLHIKEGAGAFVCGEETALIASIEGKRGVPRIRPPFPAAKGLWDKPTNINNVETFANVPWIILNGAEAFAGYGTEKSKGTKVFALAGKIKRSGLAEVPMGITIDDIIFNVGGGIKDDKKFKAVQMGGPSGGCIPVELAKSQIDYEQIAKTGAIMGSGGLIVLDETTCMVDLARFFLTFTQNESCGKCTFCRIGSKRMLEILKKICAGEGLLEDLEILEDLAHKIKNSSLCGLGQTAPNPVLTTLKYFRDEYVAHITDKRCPAHSCTALIRYTIDINKCTGCTLCARKCPVQAVYGTRKAPHGIDNDKCIKCGICYDVCTFGAVEKN